jgi:hypothetical protein
VVDYQLIFILLGILFALGVLVVMLGQVIVRSTLGVLEPYEQLSPEHLVTLAGVGARVYFKIHSDVTRYDGVDAAPRMRAEWVNVAFKLYEQGDIHGAVEGHPFARKMYQRAYAELCHARGCDARALTDRVLGDAMLAAYDQLSEAHALQCRDTLSKG